MAKKGDQKEFVLKNFEELKFVDTINCPQRGQLRLYRFHPFTKYMASKLVCSVPSSQMDQGQQQQLLYQYKDRVKIKQPHIMYAIECESQIAVKPTQMGNVELFQIYVFFEYGQLSLLELTERRLAKKYLLPEVEVWCLVKGVLQAMHFFQMHEIQHGQLSLKNIYFDEEYLLYRVYDQELIGGRWGNWVKYQQTKDPELLVLLAPETKNFLGQDISLMEQAQINQYKSDVYTFGIVLFQCLTLMQPFENAIKWLEQYYSNNLIIFLTTCVQADPNKRPDWLQLSKLPQEPSVDSKLQDINNSISLALKNGIDNGMRSNR